MNKTAHKYAVSVLLVMLFFLTLPGYADEIERLCKIPEKVADGLIGLRVAAGKVFIVSQNGAFVRFDLLNKESLEGKLKIPAMVVDFDIKLGQPVFIGGEGKLGGNIRPNWPSSAFHASRVELSDQGAFLMGGRQAYFLANNATSSLKIGNISFLQPISEGFVWKMSLSDKGHWTVDLIDSFGNTMKNVYNFTKNFQPTGLRMLPPGMEQELFISCYENGQRKLLLIGSNGHMLWKLDGPDAACPRDVAFDQMGNILFIEKDGKSLWLTKWKPEIPMG